MQIHLVNMINLCEAIALSVRGASGVLLYAPTGGCHAYELEWFWAKVAYELENLLIIIRHIGRGELPMCLIVVL